MTLKKYGEWALVTGASSGIGEEFARQLAQLKYNLVLIARRSDLLNRLADELRNKYDVRVVCAPLDLRMPNLVAAIEERISGIEVGLLINNAGFTINSNLLDSDLTKQQELIDVNVKALTTLTYHFGNTMRVAGKGGIINVASASGYLPVPKWSVYAASKAYVLHFTEALWYEFKATGIDILALCPGATNTGFGGNVDQQKGMDVGDVVKTALESLARKPSVIAGRKNRLITLGLKLLGRKALVNLGAKIVRQ